MLYPHIFKTIPLLFLLACASASHSSINNRPIIGILTQEIDYKINELFPDVYHSYIAASYVKFIEGAGARVVPVWIGQDQAYYENIINTTDGILLPGGRTWFNQSEGFADAGVTIYNLAVKKNELNQYFPLFGICLGMELIIYAAAGAKEYRTHCKALNIPLNLEFKDDYRKSQMFENISEDLAKSLREKNITINEHQFCVTEENLSELNLANDWHVLSSSTDKDGLKFISTLESKKYPFFGLQFHPEKSIYEWIPRQAMIHDEDAIAATQYFANVFVKSARKCSNKYEDRYAEQKVLIYNYPKTYTGKYNISYEESYLFKKSDENH